MQASQDDQEGLSQNRVISGENYRMRKGQPCETKQKRVLGRGNVMWKGLVANRNLPYWWDWTADCFVGRV